MKKLKDELPNSKLTIIISSISKNLIQMFDFIDDFIISDNSITTINTINSKKFDLILNFSPLKRKSYKLFLKANRKVNIIYTSRYKKNFSNNKIKLFFLNLFFDSNYLNKRNSFSNLTHQTIYMNKILKLERISSLKKPKKVNLNLNNDLKYDCLIHLSNRWINSDYILNDLIFLIEEISKKFKKISFTTDILISDNIKKVIQALKSNKKYKLIIQPKFKSWVNLIDQSKLIITPECGCSHICGLLNKNAIIIYDRNNKPDFIRREYQPYLSKSIIKINSALGKNQNKKILNYI
jgi:ADP-heptose:LPS heptosyltransferase